jgi:hypothetical protein
MGVKFFFFQIGTYLLHRFGIRGYFYAIYKRKLIQRMKSEATIFEKWTGFYLLRLKKKQTVFAAVTICLINIELLFFPVILTLFFWRNHISPVVLVFVKQLFARYDYGVWIILAVLCLFVRDKWAS